MLNIGEAIASTQPSIAKPSRKSGASTYNRLGVGCLLIRRRPPLVEAIRRTIRPSRACRALDLVRKTFHEFLSTLGLNRIFVF